MKTIIVGIGNPLLTDDGVGLRVSKELREKLGTRVGVDVLDQYANGIRLMENLIGYDRAIIVDAMKTGKHKPGTIQSVPFSRIVPTNNLGSTHDADLQSALEIGKMMGYSLPEEILIWGIEANDIKNFSEDLTEEVANAVPEAVKIILGNLE